MNSFVVIPIITLLRIFKCITACVRCFYFHRIEIEFQIIVYNNGVFCDYPLYKINHIIGIWYNFVMLPKRSSHCHHYWKHACKPTKKSSQFLHLILFSAVIITKLSFDKGFRTHTPFNKRENFILTTFSSHIVF